MKKKSEQRGARVDCILEEYNQASKNIKPIAFPKVELIKTFIMVMVVMALLAPQSKVVASRRPEMSPLL